MNERMMTRSVASRVTVKRCPAASMLAAAAVVALAMVIAAAGCATGGESAQTAASTAPPQAATEAPPSDVTAGPQSVQPAEGRPADDQLTDLEQQWGVELIGVRRTAADHMLDVRYKVLDAVKAAPLFDRGKKAVLIHIPSGNEIPVFSPAKTGPLRSTDPPIEGRVYFMFFSNPGHTVKMGDPVILKIGDYQASTSVE